MGGRVSESGRRMQSCQRAMMAVMRKCAVMVLVAFDSISQCFDAFVYFLHVYCSFLFIKVCLSFCLSHGIYEGNDRNLS